MSSTNLDQCDATLGTWGSALIMDCEGTGPSSHWVSIFLLLLLLMLLSSKACPVIMQRLLQSFRNADKQGNETQY